MSTDRNLAMLLGVLATEIDALRSANVKMSHQIDVWRSAHKSVCTVNSIYSDRLVLDQITAVGGWPEQVETQLDEIEGVPIEKLDL